MRAAGKLLFALALLAAVVTGVRYLRYDEPPAQFWARVRAGTAFAGSTAAGDDIEQAGGSRAAVKAGSAAKYGAPAGGKHILPPGGPEIGVLFIGNSLVYSHAMPQMVERLAWSDGINLRTDQSTVGGYTLQQHAARAETRAKIDEGDWRFVILQEQSRLPALDRRYVEERTLPGAINLSVQVRGSNPGVRLMLYVTPAWRDGDPELAQSLGQSPGSGVMQERINATYANLASRVSALQVPAGQAWQRVRSNYPGIGLYDDNVHPGQAGAYLIACVFYKAITGRSPVGNAYMATLDPTTARILQTIAAGG